MSVKKRDFDLGVIKGLAGIGCTDDEFALVLDTSTRTIQRHRAENKDFKQACVEGKAKKFESIRRRLHDIAEDDEHPKQLTALIFLAKCRLGYSERMVLEGAVTVQAGIADARAEAELERRFEKFMARREAKIIDVQPCPDEEAGSDSGGVPQITH